MPVKMIDQFQIYESPYIEPYEGTGRATCRICGDRIMKGEKGINFAASFTDGSYNCWTAVDCKVHQSCVTHDWARQKMERELRHYPPQ